MMSARDRLAEQLKNQESTDSILFSLLSPAEQDLVDACAFARTFDQAMFEAVLQRAVTTDGAAGVTFERIAALPFVEHAPEAPGARRIRPAFRLERIRRHVSPSGEPDLVMRRLSEALLAFHAERRDRGEPGALVEHLHHAFIVAPDAAEVELEGLYREADAAFDLPRCRELLDAVQERDYLFSRSPSLEAHARDARALYNARVQWADEYYRTTRFFERGSLLETAASIEQDGPRWITQIHATGGMGKTMFLRWFIARYCVPRRILCARVDFDFVGPDEIVREPFRVLLRLARQLDPQLPGSPLRELILRASSPSFLGTLSAVAEQFAGALGAVTLGRPIVLVLDTLEEPLLNHGESLAALLHGLAIVRRACPDLRVVLSGRYDIREKLSDCAGLGHGFGDTDGAPKSFDDVTDNRALQRFDDTEADGYLIEIRRVEVDDETRKAAVEKGDGIPFKLALLGDLLTSGPVLSAETIRAYPSADLLYLIERVIDRLPNPQLRWVLRYGVVPERLDRDFLEAVMAPHLARAMSGREAGDDPGKGLEGIPSKSSVFRTDLLRSPDEAIATGALWEELSRYASAAAWVSAGDEPGSLSFHPEVRVPMRDLLRGQAIFADLHRDAIAHFEQRAAREPGARIDRLCSSVYHRLQLDSDSAQVAWRALLDSAIGDDPEARRRLALEVLGPDFVGRDGRPRALASGTPIVSTAMLLAARWEHARAAAEIAWATMVRSAVAPGGALWTEAWKALDGAERLEREAGLDGAAPAAKALALHYRERVRTSTGAPDLPGAAEILERALSAEMSPRDRLRIERELAALLCVVRPDAAQLHHDTALALARSMDAEDKVAVDIRMSAADTLFRFGAHGAAIEHLRAALDGLLGEKVDSPETRATTALVALQLAEAELRAGRPAEAFDLVKGPLLDPTAWKPRRRALAAWASLALFEPEAAIIESAIADDHSASAPDPDVAWLLEARGEALLELHEITAANAALERARGIWDELGLRSDANRCMRRRVMACLRIAGDLKEADDVLSALERTVDSMLPDDLCSTRLLRARLSVQRLEKGPAEDVLIELARERDEDPGVATALSISLACLCHGAGDMEAHWTALAKALERTTSPWERLHWLVEAGPAAISAPAPLALVERLVEPWKQLLAGPIRLLDARYLALKSARVLSWLGMRREARWFFDRAVATIPAAPGNSDGDEDAFACSELLHLSRLLEIDTLDEAPLVDYVERAYGQYRLFLGALRVEQAESLLRRGRPTAEIEAAVGRADEWLQAGSTSTQWHARLHVLLAQMAARSGQKEIHKQRLTQARRIYRELGQPEDVVPSGSLAPSALESAGPTDTPEDDRVIVRIDRTATLQFEVRIEGPPPSLHVHTASLEAREPIPENPWTSESFVRRIGGDWQSFANELGRLLVAPEIVSRLSSSRPTDVCLKIVHRGLAALPWEIARLPDNQPLWALSSVRHLHRGARSPARDAAQIRWLQTGLSRALGRTLAADDLWGPLTEQAVSDFQLKYGLPVTRRDDQATRLHLSRATRRADLRSPIALILFPSAERSRRAMRGYNKVSHLGALYEAHGFRAMDIEDPTPARLDSLNLEHPPDVLHVSAALVDTGHEVALDFAFDYRERASSRLLITAEVLRRYLRERLPPGAPRPLVIVDVPRPPYAHELVRQLLLRNHFTAELFSASGAPALLGTMLDPPEVERLVIGLGTGALPGILAGELRRQGQLTDGDTPRLSSTALFAFDPSAPTTLGGTFAGP